MGINEKIESMGTEGLESVLELRGHSTVGELKRYETPQESYSLLRMFSRYKNPLRFTVALCVLLTILSCAPIKEVRNLHEELKQQRATIARLTNRLDKQSGKLEQYAARLAQLPEPDGEYDYNATLIKDPSILNKAFEATYQILFFLQYEKETPHSKSFNTPTKNETEEELLSIGSCFVVGGKYVLTSAHGISLEEAVRLNKQEIYVEGSKYKWKKDIIKILNNDVTYNLNYIFHDVNNADFGLLSLPLGLENEFNSAPFPLGNSTEIKAGHYVTMVGFDLGMEKNIRSGQVTSVNYERDILVIDSGANEGNSGGLLFSYRDGEPEIIGMINGKLINPRRFFGAPIEKVGFAYGINSVRDAINKYFNSENYRKTESGL